MYLFSFVFLHVRMNKFFNKKDKTILEKSTGGSKKYQLE